MNFHLQHVSDTALLVAAARAAETERQDALIQDPYAAKLAGDRGLALERDLSSESRWASFGVGLRSRFVDDFLSTELLHQSIDCVLSLGAGLDARPWRLDLPHTLRWIEVDFAPILDYKHSILNHVPPNCHLERMAADLFEADELLHVLDKARSKDGRILLLTEGLLYYLPALAIQCLAMETAKHLCFSSWIFDVNSEAMMRLDPVMGKQSIEKFGHETRLIGEQILRSVGLSGWEATDRKTFMRAGATYALARAEASGWLPDPNFPKPASNDPTGVWMFRRSA